MKKFAHIIMGKAQNFQPEKDFHSFTTEYQTTTIITVNSFAEAVEKAKAMIDQGYEAFELCGAFGQELGEKFSKAIDGKASVGYVYYEPEEKKKADAFFKDFGLAPTE